MNVADPLEPCWRGGCRSRAAEAAGASDVTTALLSLAQAVSELRGCCRCCKTGARLQEQLLQLSTQVAPRWAASPWGVAL